MNLHDLIKEMPCIWTRGEFINEVYYQHYEEGFLEAINGAANLALVAEQGGDVAVGKSCIYRQHAAERLRADTMEQRWQAKTKECNALREIIAELNDKLERQND